MPGDHTWADGDDITAANLNDFVRDQTITICTAGTLPTTSVDGRVTYQTDTARFSRWNVAASTHTWILGGVATWTNPMSGITLGNGTWSGSYTRAGTMVHLSGKLSFGSTTSVSGTIGLTLPVTPTAGGVLDVRAFKAGTNDGFIGFGEVTTGSTSVTSFISPSTAWNSTEPFTWASGCVLFVYGSFFS